MPTLQEKLQTLTRNLWWTWRPEIRAIFRDIDPKTYNRARRNPVRVLKEISSAFL
jgi:glycogen phosphorylase